MLLVAPPIVWSPPVTDPPDAICCCTAWVSCGVVVVAVQPACPLAIEAASALTDTPQTFAATSIGTCAVTGILSRLTCSDTDRLLSTFCRLTLTSVGMLVPPLPPPLVPEGVVVPSVGAVVPPVEPSVTGVPAVTSPAEVGAELVRTDRGGDVTFHGPGQLTCYPILTLPEGQGGGKADTAAYVHAVEQLVIDVLADLGLPGAGRLAEHPGVWVDPGGPAPRKVCAIGVKINRGRTMHGFALNVDPDLAMFQHIVPCGIADKGVTSLQAEGLDVTMREVVDAVVARAVERWGAAGWDRADVVWRHTPEDLAPFSRPTPVTVTPHRELVGDVVQEPPTSPTSSRSVGVRGGWRGRRRRGGRRPDRRSLTRRR